MIKISIITPVRNGADNICDCIESVKNQKVEAEHIIIDGRSSDKTVEIVNGCRSKQIRLISAPQNGVYDAMNKGLELATGNVIGILNSDDFLAGPDVLSKIKRVFTTQKVDSCYGDLIYVARGNTRRVVRYWRSGSYTPGSFYAGWMPPHPTFYVRREVYQKHGLFNLFLGSSADYELMLRFLFKHKVSAYYIPEVLVHMRTGGISGASFRNRMSANLMDRKAWRLNNLKAHPWTLWAKPLRKVIQYVDRPRTPSV